MRGSNAGRYDVRMQSIEIDPELNRLALAEAAQQYPEFAGHALRAIARPLFEGICQSMYFKPRKLASSSRPQISAFSKGRTSDRPITWR
jgi:hypothetical protein